MSPESAPLHGGKQPKPSPFPLFALIVLAGGAFAANAHWRSAPAWAAPAACLIGLAACLLVFALGCRMLKSRRVGFLAALTLGVLGTSQWHSPPFELRHLLLLLMIPAALAVGWALDRFREGREERRGDLAARAMLGIFGVLVALTPCIAHLGLLGNASGLSATNWATLACLAAAGTVVTGMSLAGSLTRWPTPEAALVLASGFLTWTGLLGLR